MQSSDCVTCSPGHCPRAAEAALYDCHAAGLPIGNAWSAIGCALRSVALRRNTTLQAVRHLTALILQPPAPSSEAEEELGGTSEGADGVLGASDVQGGGESGAGVEVAAGEAGEEEGDEGGKQIDGPTSPIRVVAAHASREVTTELAVEAGTAAAAAAAGDPGRLLLEVNSVVVVEECQKVTAAAEVTRGATSGAQTPAGAGEAAAAISAPAAPSGEAAASGAPAAPAGAPSAPDSCSAPDVESLALEELARLVAETATGSSDGYNGGQCFRTRRLLVTPTR